jgi:CRP/FNR family transcriptional regulator, cyclic AMP receptor protein
MALGRDVDDFGTAQQSRSDAATAAHISRLEMEIGMERESMTTQSACHSPKLVWEVPVESVATKKKLDPGFSAQAFLSKVGTGRTLADHRSKQVIFSQGDSADSIFYIHKGKIKLTVVSNRGKEAVVAILGAGEFFGEGCLAGQIKRMATATAMTPVSVTRLEKTAAIRVLREEPAFTELFLQHLLARSIRIEEDLVDQLFNSSEKRLARVLLLLANFGKEGKPETAIAKISQQTLAEIVGTTRSRVSFFMNKFRKLGFVSYNGTLEVHSSLLNVVLHD